MFVFYYVISSHPASSFDAVLSGVALPSQLVYSLDLLAEVARILRPSGKLTLTYRQQQQQQQALLPNKKVKLNLQIYTVIDQYKEGTFTQNN